MTLDVPHWSVTVSNSTLTLLAVLTFVGFFAARSGQPTLGRNAKDV